MNRGCQSVRSFQPFQPLTRCRRARYISACKTLASRSRGILLFGSLFDVFALVFWGAYKAADKNCEKHTSSLGTPLEATTLLGRLESSHPNKEQRQVRQYTVCALDLSLTGEWRWRSFSWPAPPHPRSPHSFWAHFTTRDVHVSHTRSPFPQPPRSVFYVWAGELREAARVAAKLGDQTDVHAYMYGCGLVVNPKSLHSRSRSRARGSDCTSHTRAKPLRLNRTQLAGLQALQFPLPFEAYIEARLGACAVGCSDATAAIF
jgi:hypothetical protein